MAYEGGYTSAVNSEQRREYEQAQIKEALETLALRQKIQQQRDQQKAQEDLAKKGAGMRLLETMAPPQPGAQPPPPGAPSVPMMPPGAPPMGMPGGMSMMPPPQPPPMPRPQGGMAPPGAGMPPGMPPAGPAAAMPPQPPGWRPSPVAPPALGGGVPGGGVPPSGVSPAAGAIPGASPPGAGGGTAGGQGFSVEKAIQAMSKAGVPPEQIVDQLDAMLPAINAANKEKLEDFRIENEAMKRAIDVYKATIAEQRASKPPAAVQTAQAAAGGGPVGDLLKNKFLPPRGKGAGGAAGVGAAAPQDGYVDYSAMAPSDPKYNNDKALGQIARETQAWTYIEKGTLPYRKGTGKGVDRNDAVMMEVARIAQKYNMTPEQIVAQPAEWKANAASLAFQTKKVDSIESVLSSFHNNVETWDRIAKGQPPQLGPGALKKGLGKIDFSDVKSINDVKMKVQKEFSDPKIVAYLTAAMAVRMDYARIMQGPQSIASLSEGMKEDAKGIIENGYNDASRAALIDVLNADTEGQLKGSKDQLGKIQKRMTSHSDTTAKKESGATGKLTPDEQKELDTLKAKYGR